MRNLVALSIRFLAGVCVRHLDARVFEGVNVYFANHTSHLDFPVIWAALPPEQRERCSPVAARDYWDRGRIRRFLARRVFHAVLIERRRVTAGSNPMVPMGDALREGRSLIVFPEGTRATDGRMREFKSGLYHLARENPGVPLVPVYLENLNRILPKGETLPVPLMSSVIFGRSLGIQEGESREAFLARATRAVKELCPNADG